MFVCIAVQKVHKQETAHIFLHRMAALEMCRVWLTGLEIDPNRNPSMYRTLLDTTYAAAVGADAKQPDAARMLIKLLTGPAADSVLKARGMERLPT